MNVISGKRACILFTNQHLIKESINSIFGGEREREKSEIYVSIEIAGMNGFVQGW